MLVVVQVSSMKTRDAGLSSSWCSRHATRASATSGRACSAAWSVFFARHAQSLQKAIDRRPADYNALACQLRLQLLQRRIRLGRQPGANASLVAGQRKRLLPAARRRHATGPPPALQQLDRATFADCELLRRSPA